MKELKQLISNELNISTIKFSTIIGSNPSNGARSPILWNACYQEYGINCRMYPLDVNKNNFNDVINYLLQKKNFMASALAVPFKEILINNEKINISETEKKIGSINCIYRKKNKFYGINTDGIAGYNSIRKFGEITNKKILLLGCGGTGKSIAANISENLNNKKNLIIAVRSPEKILEFSENIEAKTISWSDISEYIDDADIIINATTIGNLNDLDNSPLSEKQIKKIKKNKIFFDINYQPIKTKFLQNAEENNHIILNGSFMNLQQAVIAFDICNGINKEISNTFEHMNNIANV